MTEASPSSTPHWDHVFATKDLAQVSWHQDRPDMSLSLIGELARPESSIIDVGAGASFLADHLIEAGYRDITLLDISAVALDVIKTRLTTSAAVVEYIASNIAEWTPRRQFEIWHDRAVFHFLAAEERALYVRVASSAIAQGGSLILGTFAHDGPEQCSGLDVHRYDSDMIAEVFADSFIRVKSQDEQHRTPFGSDQHFCWTVLRRK